MGPSVQRPLRRAEHPDMAKRLQGVGSPLQDPACWFPAGEMHNGVSKDCFPPLAPLLLDPAFLLGLLRQRLVRPWTDKVCGLKTLE